MDETFIGNDCTIKPKGKKKGRGYHNNYKVRSLVVRGTGRAKSMVIDRVNAKALISLVNENVAKEDVVYMDEAESLQDHVPAP